MIITSVNDRLLDGGEDFLLLGNCRSPLPRLGALPAPP